MEVIYYIASILLVLLIPVLIVMLILILLKPHILNNSRFVKKPLSRSKIGIAGIVSIFLVLFSFGGVLAATEPASVRQQREAEQTAHQQAAQKEKEAAERERQRKIEASKPKIKTETKTETIPFEVTKQDDPTLPKGKTRISVQGISGERSITYEVTYTNGQETARKATSNLITKHPITQVEIVGTYVKPAEPAPTPPSSSDGYINSQGNFVPSPSNDPAGATAKCRDGTYSYSQSRRGTCSHHGGVEIWL